MNLVICGSLAHTYKFSELATELEALGFTVHIPFTSRAILTGEYTLAEIENSKGGPESPQLKMKVDVIRRYYSLIKESDVVLIANYDKKGIPGYIGGNTFLEMGFAHVLGKPLYVLNPLPDLPYKDEMLAMKPMILNGNLDKLLAAPTLTAAEVGA